MSSVNSLEVTDMAEKKHIYIGEHEGKKFTRKTHRTYAYVIIGRGCKFRDDSDGEWHALTWAGRDDLAIKAEARERKWWDEVKAIPVKIKE
jgi:hypothetical protein